MRIALLTESAFPTARSAEGGWCDRLTRGLPEHEFELYALGAGRRDPVPEPLPARLAALRHSGSGGGLTGGGRFGGALHGPRRRRALAAYRALVAALVEPDGADGFGPALYALAEAGRGGGLPALLRSGAALDVVEAAWRTPGARGTVGPGSVGQPLVRDALVAVDLLERCLRPLSAPWYGPDGLASADICHAVDGGLAVLPGLLAKHDHGTPLIITEHSLHLRERARGYRTAPYRWPVRALLLAFFRLLAREGYQQAGLITPGSSYDRRWQIHCGADPAAIRVVYEGTELADRPAAGAEPPVPTLAWSGPITPYGGLGTMLRAFAELRRQLPEAVLRIHGETPAGAGPYAQGCRELARQVDPQDPQAVVFEDASAEPAAVHRQAGVLVFSGSNGAPPRQLAEAMLSGRPVVATDVGAAREVVGPTGLLVPAEDPRALAAACAALLGDAERRSRLGNAGRLRAQELYAVEPAAGAFRALYLELVSGWPGAARSGANPPPPARLPFGRPADYWIAADSRAATGSGPGGNRVREPVPVEAGAG
jgi:glycosyltransferase involved in cell wall biosynthesis